MQKNRYKLKKIHLNRPIYACITPKKNGVYKDSKPVNKVRKNKWHGIFTKVED